MIDLLTKAIEIACKAHIGQKDKAGEPYILHPLRVMSKFSDIDYKVVAVLHDVVEDSEVSFNNLRQEGFSPIHINALVSLTRVNGKTYDEYIENVTDSIIAVDIKIEDLRDNMNLERLKQINGADIQRVKKYHNALQYLIKYKEENYI